MTRAIQDKEANKRLIEKSMRLQFMVEAMKERGDSEDMIHEVRSSSAFKL
jgi:DNA-directed RNA polymerase III subunit RPC3